MTKLSVCVPTFNGARFIGATLDSILTQTFGDFELNVSDDCSTDDTLAIVSKVLDPRVRLNINPTRLGLVGNWNRCLEVARGEYVCIFHQDDCMLPNTLGRLVAILDQHPKVGFVFSSMQTVDETGAVIGGHWTLALPSEDTIFEGIDFFKLLLGEGNLVTCSSVLARAQCYARCGHFNSLLRYTPDLEMWLRLALHYDVAYIAEPLIHLRRHARQESTEFMGTTLEVYEVWRAVEIIFREQRTAIPDSRTLYALALNHLRQWVLMFCKQALRRGLFSSVFTLLSTWLQLSFKQWRISQQRVASS